MQERELKHSHIMPQSMYKAAGKAGEPFESNLILVDHKRGTAVRTSRQLKQELLCASCEDKFSRLGEDHFARICFQGVGSFELRRELRGLTPDEVLSGRKMWLESSAESVTNTSAIKYFVVSVLWRHSICSLGGYASHYKGMLGRKYEELFRQYLFEEKNFPENVQILAYVDDNAEMASMISHPSCEKSSICGVSVKTHSFTVPGVRFRVLIGGGVERLKREVLSDIILYQWNSAQTEYAKDIATQLHRSEPKGKFKEEAENILRKRRD